MKREELDEAKKTLRKEFSDALIEERDVGWEVRMTRLDGPGDDPIRRYNFETVESVRGFVERSRMERHLCVRCGQMPYTQAGRFMYCNECVSKVLDEQGYKGLCDEEMA